MVGHYIIFNKCCEEALHTYEQAFDAKILDVKKYKDIPNPGFPMSEDDKELVLNSSIDIDGTILMCADSRDVQRIGSMMYVSIAVTNAEFVEKAWDILKVDGTINLELAPSFFAKLHGSLQDKYGVNWMFTLN